MSACVAVGTTAACQSGHSVMAYAAMPCFADSSNLSRHLLTLSTPTSANTTTRSPFTWTQSKQHICRCQQCLTQTCNPPPPPLPAPDPSPMLTHPNANAIRPATLSCNCLHPHWLANPASLPLRCWLAIGQHLCLVAAPTVPLPLALGLCCTGLPGPAHQAHQHHH